jgi:hypothetical protein
MADHIPNIATDAMRVASTENAHHPLIVPRLVKPHPLVADFNDRAFRAGVKVPAVLKRAGISNSTWMRWLRGAGHTSAVLDRLEQALSEIISEDDGNAKGHQGDSGNGAQQPGA